jgi:hypothetical protein
VTSSRRLTRVSGIMKDMKEVEVESSTGELRDMKKVEIER